MEVRYSLEGNVHDVTQNTNAIMRASHHGSSDIYTILIDNGYHTADINHHIPTHAHNVPIFASASPTQKGKEKEREEKETC